MQKTPVAIICGSYGSEAAISRKSGEMVLRTLPTDRWAAYLVEINHNDWQAEDINGNRYAVQRGDFSIIVEEEKVSFAVVFNAMHGSPGEDGKIAGYLEVLNIPQTSCDTYSAALTFNKRDCLSVLREFGIPTAKHCEIDKGEVIDIDNIIDNVGLPCFVKANRSGSSFGVYKVSRKNELIPSIEKAFEEDPQLIIEEALEGREVSVGVISWQGKVRMLPITEIVSENDFFDFAAKYEGLSEEITPAELPADWEKKIEDYSTRIYRHLNLKGFSRSEFILKDGIPHLLEVNTIPGLTAESILPQQAKAANISLAELFENALQEALQHSSTIQQL
ncbi:MAG: D-alanine--D-alanine ligase [Flavobacteriaceae bacterium]